MYTYVYIIHHIMMYTHHVYLSYLIVCEKWNVLEMFAGGDVYI